MDKATLQHYLTTDGNVFDKDQLIADISSRGFVVNGLEYWICKDVQLIIDTLEELRDEPFEIRWETKDYLGYIEGHSEIFLYVNPVESNFVIPQDYIPNFPAVPNIVPVTHGQLDYSRRSPVQWMNPKTFSKNYPKNILIVENFNYLDQNLQRFIAELSLQMLVMVIAQVNYVNIEALDNLIPDYEQYEATTMGLINEGEDISRTFE